MSGLAVGQLIGTTLVPVAAAVIFHLLIRKDTKFSKLNFWWQQIIIGIFFAIFGIGCFYFAPEYQAFTYAGFQLKVLGVFGGANAVPLIAGLVFGWPSGIISGFLAGVYRLFSYQFGSGDLLRSAECISILVAGCLAALLRTTLFDNKKPKWIYGFIIGVLMEVFHMLLSFMVVSIQTDIYYAYGVISQADIACCLVVSIALSLSLFLIALIEKERVKLDTKSKKISVKIQKWLGLTFCVSLVFVTGLTVLAFERKQERDVQTELLYSLEDAELNLDKLPAQKEKSESKTTDFDNQLKNVFRYRHVGEDGLFIVTDENNLLVATAQSAVDISAYKEDLYGKELKFTNNKHLSDYDEVKIEIIDNEKRYSSKAYIVMIPYLSSKYGSSLSKYMFVWHKYTKYCDDEKTVHGVYNIAAFLPYDEAVINAGLSIRLTCYLEALVFIGIFGVIYIFLKKVVIQNVYKINDDLKLITGGNLDIMVNVRSNEEFASLSDDINKTVGALKTFIDEANKRIDKELAVAKEIQYSSLPYVFPTSDVYDLYATMKTAKQVGGDFYDYFLIDKDHLMFLIADVSGKGIPAAMFMMRAKTLIKSLASSNEMKLNEVISKVNDELNHNNDAMMFVTGWFGILNLTNGELEFVNAGHNRPLIKLKKNHNKFEYLQMANNFVLGGLDNLQFKLEHAKLAIGDEIILYTDGVTEATSVEKKLYSDERLLNLVNSISYNSSNELLGNIGRSVDEFQKGADQADDITMLALRYKPHADIKEKSIKIKPNIKEIAKVITFIDKSLKNLKISSNVISEINLAIDEIVSDAVIRTYKVKKGSILISLKVIADTATITFKDNGRGYNPEERIARAAKIDKEQTITDEDAASLGLLYVKKSSAYMNYQFVDNQSILTIKKRININNKNKKE